MQPPLLDLPFSEYRFLFQADEKISFPEYTGSMWRGAFGHALRELACCGSKPHLPGCPYSQLFEAEQHNFVDNELTLTYKTLPVPYVFKVQRQPAREASKGDWFSVDLLLIAQANQHLVLVIDAMQRIAKVGIGKGKGRAQLKEVVQQNAFGNQSLIYADGLHFKPDCLTMIPVVTPSTAARIHIETPLNIRNDEKEFSTERFLMGVVRRISLLQRIYGNTLTDVDYVWLKHQSTLVESKANVWVDGWKKHSSRQGAYQPVRGWMGDIFLQGEALQNFWPYLYLGQWVHTGKMTNIGLGRYQLQRVTVS